MILNLNTMAASLRVRSRKKLVLETYGRIMKPPSIATKTTPET